MEKILKTNNTDANQTNFQFPTSTPTVLFNHFIKMRVYQVKYIPMDILITYLQLNYGLFNMRKMLQTELKRRRGSVDELFNLFKKQQNTTSKRNFNPNQNSKLRNSSLNMTSTTSKLSTTIISKTSHLNLNSNYFTLIPLKITTSSHSIPHIKKIKKGGEDSHFYNETLLVVADGVGGWNNKGVDPALFSKQLVINTVKAFSNTSVSESVIKNLLQEVIDSMENILGSSTLSILLFDKPNHLMRTCYIGDSLYLIARYNQIFELEFVSKEQSHGFNLPYQIGKKCDDSETATITTHKLQNKDVVILATDGLWDNLSIPLILSTINSIKTDDGFVDTKALSEVLVKKAQIVSFNKKAATPFSLKAQKYRILLPGGKIDDTTVICSQVDCDSIDNTIDETLFN